MTGSGRLRFWVPTVVGFAGLLLVGVLYLSSGLVVPRPWVFAYWAAWPAFVAYAVIHRHQPWRVMATPAVALGVWMVTVSAGDAFGGWTA